MIAWADRIVPLAMELVPQDVDGGHRLIRDDDPLGVGFGVEFAAHAQPGLGRGAADQIDDHLIADQRLGAPPAEGLGGNDPLAVSRER